MPEGQVIVSGASRGIGAAVVSELAGRGYEVVGLSRTGNSPAGKGISCDVGDEAALQAAIAEVAAAGPIRGIVNNAGLHTAAPSHELSVEDYEFIQHTNATSSMVACREVYPHLVANGGGLIINMGSLFDKVGVPGNLAYTVSKAALGAMTRVLAVEWARQGITVLNVAPGYIETNLAPDFWEDERSKKWISRRVPVGRHGSSEEVARLVAALFDEKIPFLTGETIYIDGGHGINHG
jgi:NAD(P)-dependent dehydrogenase (short-subunit alcohol dehydrogenase family)